MQEQQEEDEEARKNLEKQTLTLQAQVDMWCKQRMVKERFVADSYPGSCLFFLLCVAVRV